MHTARVVVGKPTSRRRSSPRRCRRSCSTRYWNVPNSIKVEGSGPILREEGGWFGGGGWNTAVSRAPQSPHQYRRPGCRPLEIDWNSIDIRTLKFQQPPGPNNVLGDVKFVFPNKHDVYMHDTPQKSLSPRRCAPRAMAACGCKTPISWPPAVEAGPGLEPGADHVGHRDRHDQHIALRQKIPVYITYFTLKMNDDGSISTYGDIYGHDARMAAASGFRRPVKYLGKSC